ncbi:putative sulfite reductase-associated electron transfer protein DsrJ [Desulfosporosinus acidiphilus SJ4]|uniref:Putative sulfite reductase-associated electron transfer protein DsrJ n=1 Tax=Desulfosporosinus acidiphilus (strain DSM 22704 / JCM 16185 / SJ4) TaxID=646529 RepID=I4D614_DESAJ|nr:sulfate reduction electron transfer complex DsrMKJOP subunit DsrJ [Desulfosporosinus acidiphilus]AFM41238.1 putative sulfite reductase-associated electron transfer protein DsrJ [Desulfosporosinus acidiphilus SJ4]
MYKGGRIIASLVIFVAVLAFPFFYNLGKAAAGPVINVPSNSQCVEPAAYMRANHMQLLNEWRDQYVREGKTVYVNSQGKSFDINIDTCTKCHYANSSTAVNHPAVSTTGANPATNTTGASNSVVNPSDQFCVTCHNYASVEPTCWSCHNLPGGANQ